MDISAKQLAIRIRDFAHKFPQNYMEFVIGGWTDGNLTDLTRELRYLLVEHSVHDRDRSYATTDEDTRVSVNLNARIQYRMRYDGAYVLYVLKNDRGGRCYYKTVLDGVVLYGYT